ncbi:MAG: hypothetical protein KDI46_01035 [Alphaproteobacteria bacterium]|nr:hypothetical protein [Alphaproteobacteria bacterium]
MTHHQHNTSPIPSFAAYTQNNDDLFFLFGFNKFGTSPETIRHPRPVFQTCFEALGIKKIVKKPCPVCMGLGWHGDYVMHQDCCTCEGSGMIVTHENITKLYSF